MGMKKIEKIILFVLAIALLMVNIACFWFIKDNVYFVFERNLGKYATYFLIQLAINILIIFLLYRSIKNGK